MINGTWSNAELIEWGVLYFFLSTGFNGGYSYCIPLVLMGEGSVPVPQFCQV